jgi:bacterioferritin
MYLLKSIVNRTPYQQALVRLCNDEWLAYYQYWASASLAQDARLKSELLEHAGQEREHADLVEGLLRSYGLTPERQFAGIPDNTNCGYQMPDVATDAALIGSNLDSEHRAFAAYVGALAMTDRESDRQVLQEILNDEQQHAADLQRIEREMSTAPARDPRVAQADREYAEWQKKQARIVRHPPLLKAARTLHGSIDFNGLQCSIETGRSRVRAWHDPHNGTGGMTLMRLPYGYVKGTMGVDGDQYDVFIGTDRTAPKVFIVTTMAPPSFDEVDEQKAFLGLPTAEEARRIFDAAYDDPKFFGSMTEMPFEEFKAQVLSTKDNPRLLDGTLVADGT